MEKVTFLQSNDDSTEDAIEFFVLEQTRINNRNYLLVTESEEGDSDALILKDMADESEEESHYEIVSDETELMAVAKVFEETMEDIKFETE